MGNYVVFVVAVVERRVVNVVCSLSQSHHGEKAACGEISSTVEEMALRTDL